MERLNPEKLHVEYRDDVTPTEPVPGRRYTLTHSDVTAELFLTIGLDYAFDKISRMRDEVLASWNTYEGKPLLLGYVLIDSGYAPVMSAVRNAIFRRELPLALEAIVYGDKSLFEAHPELASAPIWIYFDSVNPYFNSFENWGTPSDYM